MSTTPCGCDCHRCLGSSHCQGMQCAWPANPTVGGLYTAPLRRPPLWQRMLQPWRRRRYRKFAPLGFIPADEVRRLQED